MTTARNAAHFRATWQAHVKELSYLVLAASPDLGAAADEWGNLRTQLFDVIERATALEFPTCPHCGRDLFETGRRCVSDDCPGRECVLPEGFQP